MGALGSADTGTPSLLAIKASAMALARAAADSPPTLATWFASAGGGAGKLDVGGADALGTADTMPNGTMTPGTMPPSGRITGWLVGKPWSPDAVRCSRVYMLARSTGMLVYGGCWPSVTTSFINRSSSAPEATSTSCMSRAIFSSRLSFSELRRDSALFHGRSAQQQAEHKRKPWGTKACWAEAERRTRDHMPLHGERG